jgi:outer membrane lipoprotein-sorting protein
VVSTGKFFYKKDSRICLDYSAPTRYQVIINQKKIKITSEGKSTVYDVAKNKMMSQTQLLLTACMTGNLNSLNPDYKLTFKENATQYWIVIQPLASNKSFIKSMDVFLDKKDLSVQQIKMIEPSNDYTIYTFAGKKKNINIPDTKFNI